SARRSSGSAGTRKERLLHMRGGNTVGEKKRFLDRVLRFMGIEEEDLASERTDQADNGADAARVGTEEEDGRARVSVARSPYEASRRGRSSLAQVIPVQPTGFNDVQAIADSLLAQK